MAEAKQGQLLEVDRELPVEWEIAVIGASSLECSDELQIGEDVTAEITGEVEKVQVIAKRDKRGDITGYVRRAVIKADGAKVSKLVRRGVE